MITVKSKILVQSKCLLSWKVEKFQVVSRTAHLYSLSKGDKTKTFSWFRDENSRFGFAHGTLEG